MASQKGLGKGLGALFGESAEVQQEPLRLPIQKIEPNPDQPRKCHKTQITDRSVFTHRTYSDFCSLDLSSFVEMDTVHSSRESNKIGRAHV